MAYQTSSLLGITTGIS